MLRIALRAHADLGRSSETMKHTLLTLLLIASLGQAADVKSPVGPTTKVEFESEAVDIDLSRDGKLIAVTLFSGKRAILDSDLKQLWSNSEGGVWGWAGDTLFFNDGKRVAMTAFKEASAVAIMALGDYSVQPLAQKHESYVHAVAISPDDRLLATGDAAGTVVIWDTSTLQVKLSFIAHNSEVNALSFSDDGSLLASCGGAEVGIWSMTTNSSTMAIKLIPSEMTTNKQMNPGTSIVSVKFVPKTSLLLGQNSNEGLFVWDSKDNYGSMKALAISSHVHQMAVSPDGKAIALAPYHYVTIPLLDVEQDFATTKLLNEEGDSLAVYDLAFSPDSSTLYSVGQSKCLKIWRIK